MATHTSIGDSAIHHVQEVPFGTVTSPAMSASPTRAYFPPSKAPALVSAPSASIPIPLTTTLASKKGAYINLPSIHKVIASHNVSTIRATKSIVDDEASAPDYDEAMANIPDLDLLPPPPVYDIVNCSTSQTLLLVSSLINTILAVNDRLNCPKITLFHSRAIPNISIEAYLSRILQYAPFQNEVLLIILLYFDRIGGGCKPTHVLTNNIPRSLLRQASMTIEEVNQLPHLTTTVPGGLAGSKVTLSEKSDRSPFVSEGSMESYDDDAMDEEEPIADEIYTSSSESPIGSKLIINSFNIHRLLITSILVACKFSSDVFYPNVRYARVGGLPLSELNQLELEFLFLSQFELNTTESELQAYGNKLLMYHQRVNGTERAKYDAITPAKGEYVRLAEKKHILVPESLKQVHPSLMTAKRSQSRQPSVDYDSARAFVSVGPYRDSREIIDQDEDDMMSEKNENQVGSPTDWHSGQSTPVMSPTTLVAKQPIPRSNKMNLDHMIWPTNEFETKYTHYGGMVKDEEAARIEEEFNKASPPPEESGPTPKRKLQRLSSGTLESTPAKRTANPSKSSESEKTALPATGNKNILKPLFRKIASLTSHRSESSPAPAPEPAPQQPAMRSHPYLVRHRISPASSATNLASGYDSEDIVSPTTPTSGSSPWHHDEPMNRGDQSGAREPSLQMKPPPYGQDDGQDRGRNSRPLGPAPSTQRTPSTARGRRHYRSREPSLSTLASELTFEPTRSSLSPMNEEPSQSSSATARPSSMAPFYFSSHSQSTHMGSTSDNSPVFSASDQSYSTPPATPMNRRERAMTDSLCPRQHPFDIRSPSELSLKSPLSVDVDMDMDCDEDETTVPPLSSSTVTPRNSRLSISVQKASNKAKSAREGVETMGINSSSSASSVTSSPSITKTTLRKTGLDGSTNGKEWTRQIVPPPLHPAVQYAHPPYVASYYTAPNVQLIPGPNGFTAMSAMAAGMPPAGMMAVPRNPHAILPATSGPNSKPMATAARTSRQFAPIRPRTPMVSEEDSKGRTASTNPEPAKKKGTVASSEPKTLSQPPKLRPLVPSVMTAPPPYHPPFIAYPSPYAPLAGMPGNGSLRPPPSPHTPTMIMAVDYAPGAHGAMAHPPHFLTHAPVPGHAHPGAPTRLYIPVIPVVYNKPPATMVSPGPAAGKAPSKPSGPAKIAPRLHRPT